MTPKWIRVDRMESRAQEMPVGAKNSVLLIEDDLDTADMYELGLAVDGYPVAVALSPESALTEVDHSGRPALIVLGLGIPTMRGLEALTALRCSPITFDVPVIVLSDECDDFSEAYRRGADECFAKYKTSPKELVKYVHAALSGRYIHQLP